MYKGAMDASKNGKEWAGGSKISNADTANTAAPKWKGGSGASDPYTRDKRAEGSQGSTNFVGRKGEPGRHDYACPAPVLGFSPGSLHAHLGHFKGGDVLKKGHNLSAYVPNRGGASVLRDVDKISTRSARRVLRSGVKNAATSAVATERPVLAARLAKRSAVKTARATGGDVSLARKAGRAAVRQARKDPNSARMERREERKAKRPTPVVPRDGAGRPMY